MRPIVITLGAAGNSTWRRIDQHKHYFALGLGATLNSAGNLTYTVQHSFDDPNSNTLCTFSQSTTTVTVTFPSAHGLTTADSVIIVGSQVQAPNQTNASSIDGTYNVASVPSTTTITVTVTPSQTAVGTVTCSPMRVFNHASLAAKTTSSDGNYAYPIMAVRLNVSSYTAGNVTLTVVPAGLE